MTLAQSQRRGGVGRGASIYSVGRGSNESKASLARKHINSAGLSAPGFDLQSLPGDDALEDAGLRVNEVQRLSVAPCVVRRSLEMGRARDRRARHHDDVPLALVVVGDQLFMGDSVWHVVVPLVRARRQAGARPHPVPSSAYSLKK